MVDLVRAAGGRPEDAHFARELLQHRLEPLARDVAELGEIVHPLRDLRAGRSHEVAEGSGGDVLLDPREPVHRRVEVCAHDPIGAAEALERPQAQHTRPERPLLGPEPAQDELEVGRLDPELAGVVGPRGADTRLVDAQLPGLHLVEHSLDERRLDLRLLAGSRQDAVPVLERPFDRLARSRPVEVVDPDEVREEAGDAAPRSGRAARARPRESRVRSWPACSRRRSATESSSWSEPGPPSPRW